MARHPLVVQGLLNVEASWTHSDTPHSEGFLWTSDHPDADKSTWQHTTVTRDRYSYPSGIQTRNPSKRTAAHPRLRTGGHWDRLVNKSNCELLVFIKVHSMFPFTSSSQHIQTFRCSTPNHAVCWRLLIFVPSPYCETAWFILLADVMTSQISAVPHSYSALEAMCDNTHRLQNHTH
jgi:hypothetical protein